jgi:hypothetical protein
MIASIETVATLPGPIRGSLGFDWRIRASNPLDDSKVAALPQLARIEA